MIVNLKFKGVDDFNRPVFKDVNSNNYYGSTIKLLPDRNIGNTVEHISRYFSKHLTQLEYFGTHFGCEPIGGLSSNITLNIVI